MAKPASMPTRRQVRGGATLEDRDRGRNIILTKVRNMNVAQKAEKCIIDLPFELINNQTNAVLKKSYMTAKTAAIRNANIAVLGLAWRRCGY